MSISVRPPENATPIPEPPASAYWNLKRQLPAVERAALYEEIGLVVNRYERCEKFWLHDVRVTAIAFVVLLGFLVFFRLMELVFSGKAGFEGDLGTALAWALQLQIVVLLYKEIRRFRMVWRMWRLTKCGAEKVA